MIKVGFLSPSFRIGGAERWMLGLAKYCDPKRIQWVGTALTEWSREHPLMIREMNRYMPIYGTVVPEDSTSHDHEFVRRPGPDASTGIGIIASQADVILTWVEHSLGIMLSYYRQHYGVKVVCVSHSDWPYCCSSVQDDSDFLTAVSKRAVFGYTSDANRNVEVICNGADVDRCVPIIGREAFREKHGFSTSDIILTYVGRFSAEKNPLAAAKAVAYMGKPFKALYVGGGDTLKSKTDAEWLPTLEAIAGDRCRFIGQVDNIGDVLAATDVLVNCSNNEGFCLSIVEAWLAGVPVVSTPVGAIPEIEAEFGPMVVSVQRGASTETVSGAVATAISHPWQSTVNKARSVAWKLYTTPAMAERWTKYIEQIVTN